MIIGAMLLLCFQHVVKRFTLMDERIASLHLWVGEPVLNVVCFYGPKSRSEYPSFMEYLELVLENAPTVVSIVLLGDSNAHVDNDSETWRL